MIIVPVAEVVTQFEAALDSERRGRKQVEAKFGLFGFECGGSLKVRP